MKQRPLMNFQIYLTGLDKEKKKKVSAKNDIFQIEGDWYENNIMHKQQIKEINSESQAECVCV